MDESEDSEEMETTITNANNSNDDSEDLKELIALGQNEEWKNIRGPRPWEDNREYKEMLEKVVNKKAK
ncbi:cytochrome c oxidase assembly COX16, mitochondrial-like protein [Euroglyphus maynei]|uniref:Cytochrome c oxidase assembly COX16, mitochondrial-like protein n=1 Tax=Euroglyphus maynei TaxID=6958 RepID=A0A1Y3B2G7_EURMA|nr:cytochrome c oxidase assembly COX16, mitochondrial-like protein [Euroglyphus maynei]